MIATRTVTVRGWPWNRVQVGRLSGRQHREDWPNDERSLRLVRARCRGPRGSGQPPTHIRHDRCIEEESDGGDVPHGEGAAPHGYITLGMEAELQFKLPDGHLLYLAAFEVQELIGSLRC